MPLRAAFFNDAGVGKDDAGIAALDMLQDGGVAGGTVSHVNALASAMGIQPGQPLNETLTRLTRA